MALIREFDEDLPVLAQVMTHFDFIHRLALGHAVTYSGEKPNRCDV